MCARVSMERMVQPARGSYLNAVATCVVLYCGTLNQGVQRSRIVVHPCSHCTLVGRCQSPVLERGWDRCCCRVNNLSVKA